MGRGSGGGVELLHCPVSLFVDNSGELVDNFVLALMLGSVGLVVGAVGLIVCVMVAWDREFRDDFPTD